MGKVLSTFQHGYPGAISRSMDDVVEAFPNKSTGALAFGVPVALSTDKTGVVPFDGGTHAAADFVGVTVRNPSKTPAVYGSNEGSYAKDEMADVLVRGHIVVDMEGSPARGTAVAINTLNGKFTTGSGTGLIALTNVHVAAPADTYGRAEIVLNTRNKV